MVSAEVKINRNTYELNMQGHAGYCPGNDIVCSACSALAAALIGWVYNNPKHIKRVYRLTGCEEMLPGAGRAQLRLRGDRCLRSAFMTAVIGLAQIAQAFPKNVTVDLQFTQI